MSPPSALLPPLFMSWIQEALGTGIPAERAATCDRCAMVPGTGDPLAIAFREDLKCCTYEPWIPSFTVGRILADTSPEMTEGLRRVLAIIEERGCSPMGIHPGPVWAPARKEGRDRSGFGLHMDLRCPYFLDPEGGCAIWRHRNSVCCTWFCRHDRGAAGAERWDTLRRILGLAERKITFHCARVLGLEAEAPEAWEKLFSDALGTESEVVRITWGPWKDRNLDYFHACREIVEAMGWSEVERACGDELPAYLHALRKQHEAMLDPVIPGRLKVGRLRDVRLRPQGCHLAAYSPYAPIRLEAPVFQSLSAFDGRPTAEVLTEIRERRGLEFPRDLLLHLVDYEVLMPAE